MESDAEQKGMEHLEKIEGELEEIKERTGSGTRAVVNGILSGAGAVVGGIVALALLGWVLSIFGLIPGFGSIAASLQNAAAHFNARY